MKLILSATQLNSDITSKVNSEKRHFLYISETASTIVQFPGSNGTTFQAPIELGEDGTRNREFNKCYQIM